ncbi:MAG: ABC transporter ATP-binding protein [Bacteroidaceae bacterium]|nr:ABC transporter ATP-binding protein [Bacteroidaceae bacterium]
MKLNKTKYSTRAIVRWLWTHHRRCRLQATINVVVGLMQVGLGLVGVEMLRRLTDIATGSREGSLVLFASLFGGVMVAELLLNILLTWVRAVLGVKTQNLMQQQFFARLLKGRWSGVERFHSGDVLNRLFGDVNDIVSLMTEVLPSTVIILVQFAASFVYLYVMDSTLALIVVATAPVFVLLSRFYFHKMRRIVRKIKDSNSALQATIQESVQHKMVVKVLERGQTMVERLELRQQLLRKQVKSRARFSILTKTFVNIGFSGGYLAALVWGLFQLQDGLITVGVLMAFTQLISRIQRPLLDMARLLPTLVNSLTSSERLMELEELPLEPQLPPVRLEGKVGLRIDDVDYQYTERGRHVLRHFSYDFRPGSFTAILGETGAGKTTLIRLMLALIEPTGGRATLYTHTETGATGNAVPVSTATRCNFSYVPQGNTLFSGTIRDNLLFGNPEATTEQMHRALHLAMADFVQDLPEGLDTRCGEGGGGLSEGQAQRVAIARAILRPCRVLLLDEATSALDVQTERLLLERLKAHFTDTTIIFVTHRLAVVGFTSDQLTMYRIT